MEQKERLITLSEDAKKIIRQKFPTNLSDADFETYIYRAECVGLDPLRGHIIAQARQEKKRNPDGSDSVKWNMSIVVGIDALRLIADRTSCYSPGDDTFYEYDGTILTGARVFVKKFSQGVWHQYSGYAAMSEYCQTYWDKDKRAHVPNSMWAKMPKNQLAKCAEALALRRGFPAELAGLYEETEMEQADSQEAPYGQRGVAKLELSSEANRGHGEEGFIDEATRDAAKKEQEKLNAKRSTSKKRETAPAPITAKDVAKAVPGLKTAAEVKQPPLQPRSYAAEEGGGERRAVEFVVADIEFKEQPGTGKRYAKIHSDSEATYNSWDEGLTAAIVKHGKGVNCSFVVESNVKGDRWNIIAINYLGQIDYNAQEE